MSGTGGLGPGTLLDGRYRLRDLIAQGGMGAVYRADQASLGRAVAVKVVHARIAGPEAMARFDREAMALAGLDHPHIVRVYDRGFHDGVPFLVMELLPGPTLRELGGRDGDAGRRPGAGPGLAETVEHGAALASALAFAHRGPAPILHRDIKPGNLMLDAAGTLKVCDFGLASPRVAELTRITRRGAVLGTPAYMAPEQCGGGKVGTAADVYAAGAVLYFLLTGRPPVDPAGDLRTTAQRIRTTQPDPLARVRPDVPGELARAVHAALAKDPADRPDAEGLLRSLRAVPVPSSHGTAAEPPEAEIATLAGESRSAGPPKRRPSRPAERRPKGRLASGQVDGWAWRRLEDAERLLSGGRVEEADRGFAAVAERLNNGYTDHPAMFAAGFGRGRCMAERGHRTAAAGRLERLSDRANRVLGAGHPLARAIVAYRGRPPG
ncbi:hypothetical protein BJF79_26840 [Actinomadura sp. CNU-125]|uniref:serine/threonine-protein kinase n=1 Tax=Actinomadura sp. CNU-125 TaxID=1904961 RepID=UPI000968EEB4|nr:serine/threonine-protein kinase [Actinomadura sp. CNU-125]OLT38457.1 hypothetical protein BJF79_26840 [Actinomadura sp. CNU-125]